MYDIRDFSAIHGKKCWEESSYIGQCEHGCPADVNIPGFIMALAKGKFEDAYKIIREAMPVAGSLGRICHHPCENQCNRKQIEDPIDIMRLKRFAIDVGRPQKADLTTEKKYPDRKVAIIGSGPAGLTAADFLNRLGYPVTILEAGTTPGGMLTSAIPSFILPGSVVATEVDDLLNQGVIIKTGMTLGKNVTFDELKNIGFHAILVATGSSESIMLNIEGNEMNGIMPAIPFLKEVRKGEITHLGGKVVVVGGGNVALDVARTAVRLGAQTVHVVCLEAAGEMLAFDHELERSSQEGVLVHNSLAPMRFIGNKTGRRVKAVEFQRITRLYTKNGQLAWDLEERPGATVTLDADTVIVAIGQRTDMGFFDELPIEKDGRGQVAINSSSLMTSQEGIFICGDAGGGNKTAVDAVASGKKAANGIHAFLSGDKECHPYFQKNTSPPFELKKEMVPSFFKIKKRWFPVTVNHNNSIRSFEEIDLGFTETEAVEEAKRCLNCKQCGSCMFEMGQICFDQASRILW